jgi:carbon-monoxide dehydrogenase medium subunit
MLMGLPKFEYLNCETVEEACALLAKYEGRAKVFSGGTDLIVKMKHKEVTPGYLVNIKKIEGLTYVREEENGDVAIGALTSIQAVKNSPLIKKRMSVLHDASSVLGTRQVRNLATLGGNLCNASPAAECAPALLVLDAEVRVQREKSERWTGLDYFFTGPGTTNLGQDEILTEIKIPRPPAYGGGVYLKHSTRRIDIAMVGVAAFVVMDNTTYSDIRIALGAVGPIPFRARKAEKMLLGKEAGKRILLEAARVASEESIPIDDIRGQGDYRKEMVETLVQQAVQGAQARSK